MFKRKIKNSLDAVREKKFSLVKDAKRRYFRHKQDNELQISEEHPSKYTRHNHQNF